ncbi:MAG: hypothetical protein ACI9D5_001618 [Candidatus Endobugula sp.]|jgi:hypothetical protein
MGVGKEKRRTEKENYSILITRDLTVRYNRGQRDY